MKRLYSVVSVLLLSLALILSGCQRDNSPTSPPSSSQSQPQTITVHITRTGKKYHREGCRYLSKSDIPIDLATAKARGYTPCSVCNPRQEEMRGINPLFVFAVWVAVGTWAAIDGHPAALILIVAYILFLLLPHGIFWLWKKIKDKKSS